MTYSIVARDPKTGRFGIAVQSHAFTVGPIVPWAEAGVGAIATQAFVNVSFGPIGLEMLRNRWSADRVVAALVAGDEQADQRQIGVVDGTGAVAAHSPTAAITERHHFVLIDTSPAHGHGQRTGQAPRLSEVSDPEDGGGSRSGTRAGGGQGRRGHHGLVGARDGSDRCGRRDRGRRDADDEGRVPWAAAAPMIRGSNSKRRGAAIVVFGRAHRLRAGAGRHQ